MNTYQTIIIGLGAMGSAAAYQLAKRGNRVLAIDQFAPPHTLGSSHGETRITRLAIGEGLAYTPLALRSHEIWRDLEERSGDNLLTITGGLIVSNPSSENTLHGKVDFLRRTLDAARIYEIAHERLDSTAIRRRFPQFKVDDSDEAYYEYNAGFLRPEVCVRVQLDIASALGAVVHTDEKVLDFVAHGDGVRVVTTHGEYTADKLIISAGPWIQTFLPEAQKGLFRIFRQVLYWFDVEDARLFEPGRFPIFIADIGSGGGDGIYGFPAMDGENGGIKVATEEYQNTTTPETVDRAVTEQDISEMYKRHVEPCLTGVRSQCLRAVTCLYTSTPDGNFILDFLPGYQQIIVASPCSGHGFKHSAAIGEILAELATDGKSRLDISSFRLARFTQSASWPARVLAVLDRQYRLGYFDC